MKLLISTSASPKTLPETLQKVKAVLGPRWATFEKWLKQEIVQPDSSDFWKGVGDDAVNDEIVDDAYGVAVKAKPAIKKSPEPYRATLDYFAEVYKGSTVPTKRPVSVTPTNRPAGNSTPARKKLLDKRRLLKEELAKAEKKLGKPELLKQRDRLKAQISKISEQLKG